MASVVQYELVVVNSDTHDSKLEAGISALMLTMRNKYGICASMHYVLKAIEDCGVFRTVSKDSNSMLELRKVPEEKVQARKQAKAKLENAERMLRKYRAWYDRFLLSGDRESGAICEVYCHKLYRAVQDGYKAWLGVIA